MSVKQNKIYKFLSSNARALLRQILPQYRDSVYAGLKARAKEMEERERQVVAGNKKLMEEIEFLRFRAQSLDELHESLAQKKWPHDGSLKDKKCLEPFRNIEILPRGEVYTCCSAFLKHNYYIGNIFTDEFDAIWNSEKALKLRYSVSNGNFEYCQATCKYLCNEKDEYSVADNGFPIVPRTKEDFAESYKDCRVQTSPQVISLSCDKSCNLYCSSCRKTREVLGKEESDALYERLIKSVRPMLKDCKVLSSLGSGDLFASAACSRFYKTLDIKEFPQLTLSVITNLQLLTPQKWEEFKNLHEFPLKLIVSIDGASKKTYEKLRLGAKWETLCQNLEFFKEWRALPQNKIQLLSLNFIVQKDNFEEIEAFCRFAQSVNADMIWFQQITNWGTYSDQDFKQVNVFDPDNKNYQRAVSNLKSVLEKKWPFAIVQNIL